MKLESRLPGEISTISKCRWYHCNGRKWRGVETVTDCIFLGSKITTDGDSSHEIKTLAPWKESYDKPRQHIKKQRHHFADKGPCSQSYGFLVVTYGYESWTIKKFEHQRTDAFESWCWRRLMRLPWTARRSNQSILKEINPEYSLEGLILKLTTLATWLMWRADSLKNTLMLGKTEGRRKGGDRGWDGWMVSWLKGHEFEQTPGDSEGQGSLVCCSPWGCKESNMS